MIKVAAVFEDEVNNEYVDIGAQQVREFSPHINIGCSISSLPYLALALSEHPDVGRVLKRQWRRIGLSRRRGARSIGSPTGNLIR